MNEGYVLCFNVSEVSGGNIDATLTLSPRGQTSPSNANPLPKFIRADREREVSRADEAMELFGCI